MLSGFVNREDFADYADFYTNLKLTTPPDFNFARDVVDAWAAQAPDKLALLWCNDASDEKRLSFSDVAQISCRLAAAFDRLGLCPGDVVLLLLRRHWRFWTLVPALMRLGVVFIPATIQLTAKDIVYRCQAASVKAVVAVDEPDVLAAIQEALPDCPQVEHVILCPAELGAQTARDRGNKPSSDIPIWPTLDQLERSVSAADAAACRAPRASGADPLLIYFTSGTTGQPKMVLHNHQHPAAHVLTARFWQQLKETDLHLSVADTGWAKCGWGKIYGQWICGAAVFVYDMDRFDPLRLLERVAHHQVTTFCAPPTIYRFLIQEDLKAFDLSHLRLALTAGEPLNPEVFERFKADTGLEICEGFGQTESVVLCANYPWFPRRPGSIGKPSPLHRLMIADADGRACPPGKEGRILLRGAGHERPPGLFQAYYRDAEETGRVFPAGDYDTGDIAWQDESGYLWFVGRSDDVIKCSGYRIGPFEVESALQAHPAVLECAVTAAPDPLRGQIVKATVVLTRGYTASPELIRTLQQHVKSTTAPYKYPRIIEFVDDLPKTISGKIRRTELRQKDQTRQP